MIDKKYRVFFTENGLVHSIDENDNYVIEQNDKRDLKNYNYYESMQGYKKTKESLINFKNDFVKWVKELKKFNINYFYVPHLDYLTRKAITYSVFLRYSTNNINKLIKNGIKGIDNINFTEFYYFEKCYNAGLMSIDEEYINKKMDFYGYDFSSFYANLLTNFDFKIPIKKGTQSKYTNIKDKLKYGIYHIKIKCDDVKFKKIFSFSVNNYYTHYSLNFCLKYKKRFNITFEILDIDKEYNCLVYNDEDLIRTGDIFIDWFNNLSELKIKLPKNKLVKDLMTSIWGVMIQFERVIVKNEDEIIDYDFSEITSDKNTEYKLLEIDSFVRNGQYVENYKLIKSEKGYKRPFRIKPFLTSFSRKQIAEFILQEKIIDDVCRIQTDGIVLKKQYDFSNLEYYPKPENKTTGNYIWYSVNKNSLQEVE
jgi:hypothetical protein